MRYSNNIQPYIASSQDRLSDILEKINENRSRLVFIVTEKFELSGTLSDGDIRRWLIGPNELNLDASAEMVMNRNCKYGKIGQTEEEIEKDFVDGIDCIPIVDDNGHIMKLLFKGEMGFQIDDQIISRGSQTYIIAEIGNNHQGDIIQARKLVDFAIEAGANCAKFQMRNLSDLYNQESLEDINSSDLGTQYNLDLLTRFQLTNNELFEVFDYCKYRGITPLCTPWDLDSLKSLERYGMQAYKVASADFTNYELLRAISNTGKPFFCSTGMSSENEIKSTVDFLNDLSANYILLHCNSTYPTPFKDVNLKYIERLQEITKTLIGYSGHERGFFIPIAAVAIGAVVVEKHITTDQSLEGTDHKVSLLPNEFKEMVTQIRFLEEGLGSNQNLRLISQGELLNRENLAKSLVAKKQISIGEKITRENIIVKSPGQGIQPNRIDELVGLQANRTIPKGGFFYGSDIFKKPDKREKYFFKRPYGVPVRYHDFRTIAKNTNMDFVEFHLSYSDLKLKLNEIFKEKSKLGFAVHSPELFAGDHILDLASYDNAYREKSIDELQKVIAITRTLKEYFPYTQKPVLVVNVGGWNRDGFIKKSDTTKKYQLVNEAINSLNLSGVQLAIQTMPPFPWHYGGQSHHNLFVAAEEIVNFCDKNKAVKICFDISHAMMACNYYGWKLLDYAKKVLPYTTHLHVVDATGIDGEGVRIGKGDVDFNELSTLLNSKGKDIQFIPEVWQGHKNSGEGFWEALDYLEQYL